MASIWWEKLTLKWVKIKQISFELLIQNTGAKQCDEDTFPNVEYPARAFPGRFGDNIKK